jgi:hypothetical protein
MNGEFGPKRKVRTGLIKLFRDALDEALEADPVQPIRDGYQKVFDSNENDRIRISFSDEETLEDPVRHIRDKYQQILNNACNADADGEDQQRANQNKAGADPFLRVRGVYQEMLESNEQKYLESEKKKSEGLPWWKRLF